MIVMRWFRKNTKKLMAGVVVVLMFAFVIPSVFFRGQRGRARDITEGTFLDDAGQECQLTLRMLSDAAAELNVLTSLGLNQMTPWLANLDQFGRVGQIPALVLRQLLFPANQSAGRNRLALHQMIADESSLDSQARSELDEGIERIVGLSSQRQAALYYLLLGNEASRAGIRATDEQISFLIAARQHPQVIEALGNLSIPELCRRHGISEQTLEKVVGRFIAILRHGHLATKTLAASDAEIMKTVRDELGADNVTGSFVTIGAEFFNQDIAAPTEADLQEQFEAYKANSPGESTESNPHGFGYMLDDRVQLEYLKVDLVAAETVIAQEFAELTPQEQEEKIERFWATNKQLFRRPVSEPAGQATDQPQYIDPEYDQVAHHARDLWRQREARLRVEQLLNQAKRLSVKAAGSVADDQSVAPQAAVVSNYAELKSQLSNDALTVIHDKTEYLTPGRALRHQEFGSSYRMVSNNRLLSLLDTLFDCQPLHEGAVSGLDDPPVEVNQDIGPVISVAADGRNVAAYLIRIIGADRQRQPESLADDGRAGPAGESAPSNSNESLLRDRAETDWRYVRAYDRALQYAHQFAGQANDDWQSNLDRANTDLSSQNKDAKSAGDPLGLETLESIRTQAIQTAAQAASASTALDRRTRQQLDAVQDILQQSAQLARRRAQTEAEGLAVLENPEDFSCLVFKELSVSVATEQQYQQRKALVALQLAEQNQCLMCLTHFDPVSIEKRNRFEPFLSEASQ